MKTLLKRMAQFVADEGGPTAVEYAVMLMLILLVCLSVITLIGQSASTSFLQTSDSIDAVTP